APALILAAGDVALLMQSPAAMEKWHDLARLFAPQPVPKEEARDIVEGLFSTNKYLFHNYNFKLTGFYLRTGETALNEQQQTFGEMEELFHKAKRTKFSNLRFLNEKTRQPGYLIRTEIPTREPLLIFLYFQRSFSTPSKVYTELLLDKKYKNLEELDNYDYGIYQDGVLLEERNNTYSKLLSDALPPVGEVKTLKLTSKRSELLYHAPNNVVIKIGKNSGGYIKPLSLFSYVFTLLTLAVIVFTIINFMTNALPGNLNFLKQMKPSLRNQLQVWVISMILVSFGSIGFVTVWYFQQSSNEYHKGRLDRKVTSALANVNYEIKAWRRERAEEHQVEERIAQRIEKELGIKERQEFERQEQEKHASDLDAFSLSSLIPLISEVHRLDVNIYDLHGNLIASSEQDIFKKGLVAPKMGAHAYQQLTRLGYDRSDQDESIGTLEYLAAYVPLKNMEDKTLAYMGIPYYARQRELRSDVRDFMSTLLNVYVFLLLIAGSLAILISNSITKPLSQLSENLQKLRLGGNQKVSWKRKDEIGALVNEYNQAVKKSKKAPACWRNPSGKTPGGKWRSRWRMKSKTR
ncbi:MAG: methyl-accepting chemotaxis protein, partial [Bacteroidota bacterium]